MEIFEYVAVLTSIIIGLGIAHLLQGVARVIQHPDRVRLYWVHLTWVAYMFVTAVFWWWWEFRLGELEVWTFQIYLFVILYAVNIYLLCALLFPADLEGYDGYRDYFYSRRGWFFGLSAVSFTVDYADSWLKGAEHLVLRSRSPLGFVRRIILWGCVAPPRNRVDHSSSSRLDPAALRHPRSCNGLRLRSTSGEPRGPDTIVQSCLIQQKQRYSAY